MSRRNEAFPYGLVREYNPWPGGTVSVYEGFVTARIPDTRRPAFEALLNVLGPLVGESFGLAMRERSADGVRSHVERVDGIVFLEQDDELVGFASARYLLPLYKIFYLHGVAIHPKAKGKGGSKELIKALASLAPSWPIAFTTQNPVMYDVLRGLYGKTYPHPYVSDIPDAVQSIARYIMQYRPCRFDSCKGVAEGLYDECLYATLPASRDPIVNDWFASALEVEDGRTRNGFLFLGE